MGRFQAGAGLLALAALPWGGLAAAPPPGTGGDRLFVQSGRWGRITDGGTFGDGASHPASANGYATLAALQAVYPFATSLSDDVDGLMIQAAWNAAGQANQGRVILPSGSFHAPRAGLVHPPGTHAKLEGNGRDTVIIGSKACAAGHPVFTIVDEMSGRDGAVSNLAIRGLETAVRTGLGSQGVANAALYKPGCYGIHLTNSDYVRYDNLAFYNLDRTLDWDLPTGNNYMVTFTHCEFAFNNEGFSLHALSGPDAVATNSFERIIVEDSVIANNNIGAVIEFGDAGSRAIVADAYFHHDSFDYNIVRQMVTLGGVASNFRQNQVLLDANHIETNSDISGTGSEILNGGDMSLTNNIAVRFGALPVSLVAPTSYWAATFLAGNRMPFAFTFVGNAAGGVFPNVVDGGGNEGGDLYHTAQGDIGTARRLPVGNSLPSPYTLQPEDMHDGQHLLIAAGGGAVTVPSDQTGPFFMTNTRLVFTCSPNVACSFAPAAGVSIVSSATGLTFGSAASGKPAEAYLTKSGPNAWLATGQMN